MAWHRLSGKFIGSAVAAGLAMAVITGHHAPTSGGSKATVTAVYGSNEALANQVAASGYGWTGSQTTCLDRLWTRESAGGWGPAGDEPPSGAYRRPPPP